MEQRNGEHGIVQDLRAIILDTEHFCDAVKSDTEISSLISWVHSLSSTLYDIFVKISSISKCVVRICFYLIILDQLLDCCIRIFLLVKLCKFRLN